MQSPSLPSLRAIGSSAGTAARPWLLPTLGSRLLLMAAARGPGCPGLAAMSSGRAGLPERRSCSGAGARSGRRARWRTPPVRTVFLARDFQNN